MGPSRSCWNSTSEFQPEEITSKVPIRKKSGNLFNDPRINKSFVGNIFKRLTLFKVFLSNTNNSFSY